MERKPDVGRLGGGLIAAALGQSEWRTPLDAYQIIRGEIHEERESDNIDRGVFLEPALRNWYAKKVEAAYVELPGTVFHPELPWASYTPDGIVTLPGATRLLEIKSPGEGQLGDWGEEGTDQIPKDAFFQVVWGIAVLNPSRGITSCDVAAFIGGKLRLFRYERDLDLEAEVIQRAKRFMDEYVVPGIPPKPTFAKSDTEWVKKRWPSHTRDHATSSALTPEQQRLLAAYVEAYQRESLAIDSLTALENELKASVVGEASGVVNDQGPLYYYGLKRLDWKQTAPRKSTDWQEVAGYLHNMLILRCGKDGYNEQRYIEIQKEYTTEKPGPRPLRPYFTKEKP